MFTGMSAEAGSVFGSRRRRRERGFALLLCVGIAACGETSHDGGTLAPPPLPTTTAHPTPAAESTPTPHVGAGELDPGFGQDGLTVLSDLDGLRIARRGLFVFADGRIVLLAFERDENGSPTALLRFEIAADGRGDGLDALSTASRPLRSLVPVIAAVAPDGGAIVLGRPAGETGHLVAARLTPGGTLDATFAHAGLSAIDLDEVIDVLPLVDGRIVIAGERDRALTLMRLAPDGSIDGSFGRDGFAPLPVPSQTDYEKHYLPSDLAVTQDGRILVAVTYIESISFAPRIIAFTDAGELDRAFGDGGVVEYSVLGTGGSVTSGRDGSAYRYAHGDLLQVGIDGSLTKFAIDRETYYADFGVLVGATNGSVVLAGSGLKPDVPRPFDCGTNFQGVCRRGAIVVKDSPRPGCSISDSAITAPRSPTCRHQTVPRTWSAHWRSSQHPTTD